MLLDWRGHVNAEYASSVKSCLYLYSYLFKGTKKDYIIAANDSGENEDETEEEIYLNGRFLCSMDAMNRALGYHTYPPQQPSAVSIAVKSKEQVEARFPDFINKYFKNVCKTFNSLKQII